MGETHKEYMRLSAFRDHLGVVTIIGEDPPAPDNRVDLDPVIRDVYGFPVARITYKAHPNDAEIERLYIPKMKEILLEAGAVAAFGVPESVTNGFLPNTKHILGTLRMGDDAAASVTNRWGRFHDLENLYNADGGVFVTSTGYNPTLTTQALAWRTAEGIVGSER
ncbi:MAG: GMC family oxidoreductase [Deltaproteobacteria bacterium]|nr:GMC family oxidoreductase [Deltaproteobacteria bacterium]